MDQEKEKANGRTPRGFEETFADPGKKIKVVQTPVPENQGRPQGISLYIAMEYAELGDMQNLIN